MLSYIAWHSVQRTLGVYIPARGSGGMPPGKFLKFVLLTLNLEELLSKNYIVVKFILGG